ncbi:nucleotidyltransferase substrate binding protein [Pedobacter cryophilus]|uniref:Nucleotidyltransferase n=1 Tax=Pedobacter cryophilus TaxID=2571271 RepID=A0A4V5NXD3_9SPHI|nr:nucleotidyltransferase substrate binding protein [Pedobacter cryophilus]TKB97537.1 nucleotidyltransferase [Pedobacter cryophilus]
MEQDIRWEQRFSNYKKALYKLDEAVDYIKLHVINMPKDLENTNLVLDEIIREGLIQRFEYTHELAWNVMKDYAEYQGNTNITGSRDASREAFLMNLVKDGEVWMDMIKSRNKTSHTYNEVTASEIFQNIIDHYHTAFHQFQLKMETLLSGAQTKLF